MNTEIEYEAGSYNPPQIVLEMTLETKAGSSLGLPDGVDLFNEP